MKLVLYSVLLPYLAINAGWMVAEAGRQPWVVYGLMKTSEGVSPIALSQVVFSLAALVIFYTVLLIADVYLIIKYAKKGPESEVKYGLEGGVKHVS
ncbi:cytochrome d ubiquinol oxidase subunit I [Mesobacillus selenatarsenatis SF-1]|uniref:Cytochrome d ubiquinol oxidase subunit I n=1 Tax=Mesobacillus selenatarsenatis (strain DSM 18680 / JCM 14380 / FERM P-15431 / SF-1) TaxID=1321606 RepID=A0A0A8X6D1_MESS1|nr:cytochrome d ubiquinol oxidase subunit I [Mesobacillus selenatarsenatis SF-1]